MQKEPSRQDRPEAPDLRGYLGVLRRRKLTIALVVSVVMGSTLAFSLWQTPMYESTVKVLVKPINASQVVQGVSVSSIIDLETEKGLVESPAVAGLARKALGGGTQTDELLRHLSVSVPANTQFLEVTFASPNAQDAARGAQAFADAYLDFRRRQATDAFATAAQGYERQIEQLQTQVSSKQSQLASAAAGSAAAATLQAEINSLNSRIAILQAGVAPLLAPSIDPGQIVAPAVVPTSPASPDFLRNLALALVVGLVLGVGAAFLQERLDDRLTDREDFEEHLGAPVLGIVPKSPGQKNKETPKLSVLDDPKTPAAEAYRTIRAGLQHLTRKEDFRVLAVTSPMIGDGKTTVSANLAVVLAQTGKRVLAISCDLHRPRLHQCFDLENAVGLTTLLGNEASLGDVVGRTGLDTLRVLPSGPAVPNPAELLASSEMERLLTELRRTTDYLILDTPPVIAVADALVLAPKTDGVLVVVDANRTEREALSFARREIEQAGGRIVGGVYHKFDPARARTYQPYYQYYYSGRYFQDGEAKTRRRPRRRSATPRPHENIWR
ncbi:MAG: polysaccharide biosynthesis tyrosine autokinase [Actinomycetota bacterium]